MDFGGGSPEPIGGRKWRLTVQLLLGIGLVIFSGWLGGQLVYEFGVGVR